MMQHQLGLIVLLLSFSFSHQASIPLEDQGRDKCSNDERSVTEATCKYCFQGENFMNAYVANLSPTIAPSSMVQYESAVYFIQDDPSGHRLKFLNITMDVGKADATLYWSKKPAFTSRNCMPVLVGKDWKEVEMNLRMAEEDSIVIFTHKLYLSEKDIDMTIGPKRLTIATLVGQSMLRTDIKRIAAAGGHVLSNLRLPENFKDSPLLKGHLFVFSPLDTDTSDLYENDPTVNLANLMVIDDHGALCSKPKPQMVELHNDWTPQTSKFSYLPRPTVDPSTNRLTFSDHYGTHLEFGTQFIPGGRMSAAQHPICQTLGQCLKISALGYRARESIPVSVFTDWEAKYNQKVPEMVFVQTGCEDLTEDDRCPGLSYEAVEYLLSNRSVKVIGTDGGLLDRTSDRFKLQADMAVAKRDAIGLVRMNAAGLSKLSESSPSMCLLNYFRIEGGTGSPAAIVAFPPIIPSLVPDRSAASTAAPSGAASLAPSLIPSLIPLDEKVGDKCSNNSRSVNEATCKFCDEDGNVWNANVANLSPKIAPSGKIQYQVSVYFIEDDPKGRMLKFLNISMDVDSAGTTVFWTKKPVGFTSRNCVPVRVCTDQRSVEAYLRMALDDSIVIFTHKLHLSNKDIERAVGPKRLTIATLVGESLPLGLIKRITSAGGHVLSNLRLPETFKETLQFSGHLFVFSPLDTDSSDLYESDPTINLANFVVVDDQDSALCTNTRMIELHNDWTSKTPTFPNVPRPAIDPRSNRFTFSDHYGTHIEFGSHLTSGGRMTADQHPICQTLGRCAKVTTFGYQSHELIPASVFKDWEFRNQRKVPEMVFVQTGCQDLTEEDRCPGLSREAVDFLLNERSVKVIGTDSGVLDRTFDRFKLKSDMAVARHNAVELVRMRSAGLDALSESIPDTCLLNYFRIEGGTGSPAAVVAFQSILPLSELSGDRSAAGRMSAQMLCPAIKYGAMDRSVDQATCLFCHKPPLERSTYIADLSSEIAPSNDVQYTSSVYHVENDRYGRTFKLVNVSIDITSASVTAFWTMKPLRFSSKDCVRIRFVDNLRSLKNILRYDDKELIIIFTRPIYLSAVDMQLFIGMKRLTIGTLAGNMLPFEVIRKIVKSGVHVLTNVKLPENFDMRNEELYGHLFVFSPLDLDTSSATEDESFSVNLAELAVTEGAELCSVSKRIIQLHNDWNSKIPHFSTTPRPELDTRKNRFTFNDHYGTHIDFGTHFSPGGKLSASQQPICYSVGYCVKIHAEGYKREDPIPLSVFRDWEIKHNRLLPEMVFVETGCSERHWNDPKKYLTECPGISVEAVEFLLTERSVRVLGTDSPLLDPPMNRWRLLSHVAIASHDAIGIVELKSAGLEQLSDEIPTMCLLNYLRIRSGTGSPVAVSAFELDEKMPSSGDTMMVKEQSNGSQEKSNGAKESNPKVIHV